MAITIQDLAFHRGLKTDDKGSYSMGDINAVGLAMLGGCEICEATIAAYNAYPSRGGSWRCEDCIGNSGWEDVTEANLDIFGEVDETSPLSVFNDREIATILHGLRMIQCEGRIEGCAAGDCDHFDGLEALSNEEIDKLCERLNYGVEQPKDERPAGGTDESSYVMEADDPLVQKQMVQCPQCLGLPVHCNGYCADTGFVSKNSSEEWYRQNAEPGR